MALWKLLLGVTLLGHACHGCIRLLEGCRDSYDTSHAATFCENQEKIMGCLGRIDCEPGYEVNREELIVQAYRAQEDHGCHDLGTRQEAALQTVLAAVVVAMVTSRWV